MKSTAVVPLVMLGCAALILGACASGGGSAAAGGEAAGAGGAVSVSITNDLVPPVSITVWMVPETGSRRRLGSVPPNGQQTFSYSPVGRSMEHRLMASTEEGREIASNPFTLEGITSVRWGPSSRVVRLEPRGT